MKHGFEQKDKSKDVINLPEPSYSGGLSVEEALHKRRSIRDYTGRPITLAEVSQLLWAAQGITGSKGERTAPSAGATYPLETYLVAGNVDSLTEGVYKYQPHRHALVRFNSRDIRSALAGASFGQGFIGDGAVSIVFAAVYERTTRFYGQKGVRYVHMDVAHAAQNVHLQAESLNLGTVVIGAFDEDRVKRLLNLPDNEFPLYIMPIGRKK